MEHHHTEQPPEPTNPIQEQDVPEWYHHEPAWLSWCTDEDALLSFTTLATRHQIPHQEWRDCFEQFYFGSYPTMRHLCQALMEDYGAHYGIAALAEQCEMPYDVITYNYSRVEAWAHELLHIEQCGERVHAFWEFTSSPVS